MTLRLVRRRDRLADAADSRLQSGLSDRRSNRFEARGKARAGTRGLLFAALLAEGLLLAIATPAFGLPDGRAYEMLTPPEKTGAEDVFGAAGQSDDVGVSSAAGDEFLFHTRAAYGAFPAAGENTYVFSRGSGGWSAAAAASPSLGVQSFGDVLFGPAGFSHLALSDAVGSSAGEGVVSVVDLLGPPGGPYATIDSSPREPAQEARLLGASADLGKVILGSRDHGLAPGASGQDPESEALYESSGGALRLANVDSGGALLSPCGAVLGLGTSATRGAVSADGSRVFLTAPDPEGTGAGCWDGGSTNPPQLYMRLNGATTTELSAPEPGVTDPSGPHPTAFVGASADGSRVFFMSEGELTADDAGIHDPELYEYDTATASLRRISSGETGSAAGDVYSVPAVSADGSAVYFTALGRLTAGAPAPGGEEVDLYRYDTADAVTTYVATVNQGDYADSFADRWWGFPHDEEIGLDPAANWETTPDGRFLLFATTHNGGALDGIDEVYRYDSAAAPGERLTCVSCPASGEASAGALFARSAFVADDPAGAPPRAISADGSYVFFDTAEALVPTDTNERIDVYEWHEGQISAITPGHDADDSFLLDSSADGSNVFFGTHARLVEADTDLSGDLYDARIGGGFPGGTPGPCEGDSCQVTLPAPERPTPATATSPGPGNPRLARRRHRRKHPRAKGKAQGGHRHAQGDRRTAR